MMPFAWRRPRRYRGARCFRRERSDPMITPRSRVDVDSPGFQPKEKSHVEKALTCETVGCYRTRVASAKRARGSASASHERTPCRDRAPAPCSRKSKTAPRPTSWGYRERPFRNEARAASGVRGRSPGGNQPNEALFAWAFSLLLPAVLLGL